MSVNLFGRGNRLIARALRACAGGNAVYARGPSTVPVTAWLGESRPEAEDRGPVRLESRRRDVIVAAAELVLAGLRALPEPGDRITLTLDTGDATFEAEPLGDEKCWRWSDPQETLLRIHVRPVG